MKKLIFLLVLLGASPALAQIPVGGGGGGGGGDVNITQVGGNSVTSTVPISGTISCTNCSGTGASTNEDTASANLEILSPGGYVRKATPATTSGLDGDWEPLQGLAGRLYTSSTIDAALPAGTNAIGKLAANSGIDIGDVDVTSIVPGFGATNAGKREDDPHTSLDVGYMSLAIVQNTATTGLGADGDYAPLRLDSNGRLQVVIGASASLTVSDGAGAMNVICDSGCGGVQYTHDAALTIGTSSVMLSGARASAAAPTNVTADNDAVALWALQSGALVTQPSYAGVLGVAGNGGVTTGVQRVTIANDSTGILAAVTNVATIGTSVTPGTAAANLGKAEDALHVSADTGVQMLAIRQDTASTGLGTDGDYAPLRLDANGRLQVVVGASSTITVTDGSGSLNVICDSGCGSGTQYAEDLAHTTADSMTFVAAIRRDTTPSSSSTTAGDYSALNVDANGRLYTNTVLYDAAGAALSLASDKAEDSVHTTADTGPFVLAVRRDTLASSSSVDGEYVSFNTNATGALWTAPTASTNGGADALKYTSAGSTEDKHAVKASAGTLYSITATNTAATVAYIRCENDTSANTTAGSETPEIDLAIPGATTGAGITFSFPVGYSFSTALTCWVVTGAADTDVTEVAANAVKLLYTFK